MNKFFFSVLLLIAGAASAQQKTVFRDANAVTRPVDDFHAIELSSAIDLHLSQGNENAVAVSAAGEENREGIKTVVKNGVLKIWFEPKRWYKGSGKHIRVYVSARSLKKLEVSGACDVTVQGEGLKGEELALEFSGASDFEGKVMVKSLKIDASGASDIVVSGSAEDCVVDASGASHIKAFNLPTVHCRVDASGASDVQIQVSKILHVEASGASTVGYSGEGTIGTLNTSGASQVKKKS